MQKTRKITKLNQVESLSTLKDFDLLQKYNTVNKLKINSNDLKSYLDLFSDNYKKTKFDNSNKALIFSNGYHKHNYIINNDIEFISMFKLKNSNLSNLSKLLLDTDTLKNICKIKDTELYISSNEIEYLNSKVNITNDIDKLDNNILDSFFESEYNNSILVNKLELLKTLENSMLFTSNNKTKDTLNHVNFKINRDKLFIASTDGYKLIVNELNVYYDMLEESNFNIHKMNIKPLIKVLKSKIFKDIHNIEIFFEIKENKIISICIKLDNEGLIKIRTDNSQYPNYNMIIPKNQFKKLTITNLKSLITNLENLSKLESDKLKLVELIHDFNSHELTFKTNKSNINFYDFEYNIIENKKDNKELTNDIKIQFNLDYLITCLNSVNSSNNKVELNLREVLSPCLIENNINTGLIMLMPVRY